MEMPSGPISNHVISYVVSRSNIAISCDAEIVWFR